MGTISDYVPSTVPMVPSLIVHCVNEVDLHGLNDKVCKISDAEKYVTEPPWRRPS
jgi:Rac GTPase-activating protein 1